MVLDKLIQFIVHLSWEKNKKRKLVSKYTPSGKYVELGEYLLFETNGIEHSDGGIIFQRTLICMKRWEENNPTPEQAKSERDGKTTKICLEVWNIHKDYGKEIVGKVVVQYQQLMNT